MFFLLVIILCLVILSVLLYLWRPVEKEVKIIAPEPEPVREIERQIEQVKVEQKPPEVERLAELLERFKGDTSGWDSFIAIGDIYRKGAYPRFLPNEEMALKLYKLAAMCPNGQVAGLAQTKYIETYDDPIKSIDKAGEMLPITYGLEACDVAENVIKSTPWSMFEKPKMVKLEKAKPVPTAPVVPLFGDLFAGMADTDTAIDVPAFRTDSQNVHDHGVNAITKFNLDKIAGNINIRKFDNNGVRAAILSSDANATEKADAMHVIDKLSDNIHSSYNMSERDALNATWNKIQNSENKQDLINTLTKQLASAIEHGHVVCSTGKIARIVGTFDGIDNEYARPTWALKEEIAGKAAQIRDRVEDTHAAREEFAREVKTEYVDKLGMNDKIIQKYIDEYSEGF